MTRGFCATLLLVVASCGGSDGGGDGPPALTASVVEVIQGDGQTDTVGQQLPLAIRVQVMDTATVSTAAGFAPPEGTPVPVPGQLVNFVVTSGGGSVFAGAALTDSLGRAQELWTLGPTAGAQCLEARAVDQETGEPITFAQVCATAVPGPVATVHFTAATVRTEIGVSFAVPIAAADAFGNPVPAPQPGSPDTLALTPAGNGWSAVAGMLGSPRLVLGTDTLWVFVHPRSGPYTWRKILGDTTWVETGVLQRISTGRGTPWCLDAPADQFPHDSAAMYRSTNVLVTRQIAGGAIDSINTAAVRDSVLCHHTYGRDTQWAEERGAYARLLVGYFPPQSHGQFHLDTYQRDGTKAFFLSGSGSSDTLFVTR